MSKKQRDIMQMRFRYQVKKQDRGFYLVVDKSNGQTVGHYTTRDAARESAAIANEANRNEGAHVHAA